MFSYGYIPTYTKVPKLSRILIQSSDKLPNLIGNLDGIPRRSKENGDSILIPGGRAIVGHYFKNIIFRETHLQIRKVWEIQNLSEPLLYLNQFKNTYHIKSIKKHNFLQNFHVTDHCGSLLFTKVFLLFYVIRQGGIPFRPAITPCELVSFFSFV